MSSLFSVRFIYRPIVRKIWFKRQTDDSVRGNSSTPLTAPSAVTLANSLRLPSPTIVFDPAPQLHRTKIRVWRSPRYRRKQAYCCKCDSVRKYESEDYCVCGHSRKACNACSEARPQNSCHVRVGASLALQDLLIHTMMPISETYDILDQLSYQERQLLWCANQIFPDQQSLYNFAIELNTSKEDLIAIGALYKRDLTVEEIYNLWNDCIVSSPRHQISSIR